MLKPNIKGKTAVMQELGNRLKARREEMGLTLRDIEQSTKIGIRLLGKMEDGAFDALPEGIFARNFVRQYCDEVGLDPEPFLAVFEQEPEDEPEDAVVASKKSSWGVLLAVVVMLVIAGLVSVQQGWFSSGPDSSTDAAASGERVQQNPVETFSSQVDPGTEADSLNLEQVPIDTGKSPVKEQGLDDAAEMDQGMLVPDELAATDDDLALSLRFQVTERCWVYLKCPEREMDFMLEPGEVYAVSCGHPVFLTLGNVHAVTLTVNGVDQPLPMARRVLRDYRLQAPAVEVAP